MTTALLKPPSSPPETLELVPAYFDVNLIVTPDDNPLYSQQQLADLLESMREFKQLVPGWLAPAQHLRQDQRLCLEGNRRLAVARTRLVLLGVRSGALRLRGGANPVDNAASYLPSGDGT